MVSSYTGGMNVTMEKVLIGLLSVASGQLSVVSCLQSAVSCWPTDIYPCP